MVRLAQACGLALLLLPLEVSACSCSGPRNALEAQAATLILEGRVVRIEYRDVPLPSLDASNFREPVAVTLEVSRSWRSRAPAVTIVTTGMSGGDCGFPFAAGVEYVVPVYENALGELVTSSCAGVQTVWAARSVLPQLGRGYAPVPSPSWPDPDPPLWLAIVLGYSVIAAATTLSLLVRLRRSPVHQSIYVRTQEGAS